jgi:hypothetical protein
MHLYIRFTHMQAAFKQYSLSYVNFIITFVTRKEKQFYRVPMYILELHFGITIIIWKPTGCVKKSYII